MSDNTKRILIMEDTDIFAEILLELLDSPDYTLERAVNGFEGIKKVYEFLPHLIITDVEMPFFKGYQVTRFLKSRKNTSAIPIILFTSHEETHSFYGTSADMHIEKSPDNYQSLSDAVEKMLSAPQDIDFSVIEREGKKINDASIIEIMNNLLDTKLLQTTIMSMLIELANKPLSLETMVKEIFDLLHTVCESPLAAMMICGSQNRLHVYTANPAGFSAEIVDNFLAMSDSDFKSFFPDFAAEVKNKKDFYPPGDNDKKILSFTTIPLTIRGEIFATVHIANTINNYFSPVMMGNITFFLGAATTIIAYTLCRDEPAELQEMPG